MGSLRTAKSSLHKTFFLTKDGLDNLKNRLNTLVQDRMKIRERLKMMDPQERTQSVASSEELQLLEIAETEATKIAEIIDNATLVKTLKNPTKVQVGSNVTLKDGAKSVTYMVVSALEVDPLEGKISEEGPIGKALLGKKVKDTISITTPKGEDRNYTIVSIE